MVASRFTRFCNVEQLININTFNPVTKVRKAIEKQAKK
jgi:hypothetical protein